MSVEAKREQWYEADVATEFECVTASGSHVAFPSPGGGGSTVTVVALAAAGSRGGGVSMRAHSAAVTALSFSPFSDVTLASGGADGTVKLWQAAGAAADSGVDVTGPIGTSMQHVFSVKGGAGRLWASAVPCRVCGYEHSWRPCSCWCAELATLVSPSPAAGAVASLSHHPNAAGVVAVGYAKTGVASMWDGSGGACIWSSSSGGDGASTPLALRTHAVSWMANGTQLVTASSDKRVRVLDGRTGTAVTAFEAHQGTTCPLSASATDCPLAYQR